MQLCHPDFRSFGRIVTQCGAWKREEKIQMGTIEVQFPHRKIAAHMCGRGVGGFVNLLNSCLHSTIWHQKPPLHITSLSEIVEHIDMYFLKWKEDCKSIFYIDNRKIALKLLLPVDPLKLTCLSVVIVLSSPALQSLSISCKTRVLYIIPLQVWLHIPGFRRCSNLWFCLIKTF